MCITASMAPASSWAQSDVSPPSGIYVCVDAKGRRITSDRPIMDCLDREQRELNTNGVTRRVIGPSLTAEERAKLEAKLQEEEAAKAREKERRLKEYALLSRYPNPTVHEAERKKQLQSVDETLAFIEKQTADLRETEKKLNEEMEFYQSNPQKAPNTLKSRVASNKGQLKQQEVMAANQLEEKKRINARFDAELIQLKVLWARTPGSGNTPPTSTTPASASSNSAGK